jgi:aspartyl-tRNA(Asn)/glutamyl-tRNA(Gln) amidotransferase subunit C
VAIDRAQVRHVARLARLALSAGEEERFAAQLQHVLEYIERLQQVDVSGVPPLSFAGDLGDTAGGEGTEPRLPLREDVPKPCLPREKVLAQAPQADEQAFLVPRILE